MKKITYFSIISFSIALSFFSCEKEIDLDIHPTEQNLVVEGKIEPFAPPIVVLTKTQGYFDPMDLTALSNMFVHNAVVTVDNGTGTYPLTELCASSIPSFLIPTIESLLGVPIQGLADMGYCAYISLDPNSWGEEGKTYTLNIESDGMTYTSTTKIPTAIPLDSAWFEVYGTKDSLGYAWATLSDPDSIGNAYRWYAKRINQYLYDSLAGKQKDADFIAPLGSAFDDEFFNGLKFDFTVNRGIEKGSDKQDDHNGEWGFFKVGDTIAIKFTTIDHDVYTFLKMYETQQFTQGNPFATPSNVPSNISNGALGVWAGYGISYDTIIATAPL